MRIIFAIIVLFSFIDGWSCELNIPNHVIVVGESNGSWPFESKDCSADSINEVYNVLRDQKGLIPLSRITAAINESTKIFSDSQTITVENIYDLIQKNFTEIEDAQSVVTSPFQGNLIAVENESNVALHCHPCQFVGEEVLRLNVKNFKSGEKNYSFPAKFTRYVEAFKIKQSLPAFTKNLSPEMFEKVRVPSSAYAQYLTDLSKLNFYKTNKSLRAGEIIRTSDLSPQTLVNAGEQVELIFESSQIVLKSHALSRQNGGLGDSIEVWNQTTGKKYSGKVIDHKRVSVDL
ncbi:MAG: flagellar basal body P-ring formation chaperone FlgA [Bacteriovoracaceae bacterium]|nr:flagellar basal body P-ring formation chaperone FlgA [Bacteriovoracaceae bacterium]